MDQNVTSTPETREPSSLGRLLRQLFFIALAVLLALNVFIQAPHPHFGLEKFPGFWAVFGLGAALVLGKGAKGLAHTVLGKKEDFYDHPAD